MPNQGGQFGTFQGGPFVGGVPGAGVIGEFLFCIVGIGPSEERGGIYADDGFMCSLGPYDAELGQQREEACLSGVREWLLEA